MNTYFIQKTLFYCYLPILLQIGEDHVQSKVAFRHDSRQKCLRDFIFAIFVIFRKSRSNGLITFLFLIEYMPSKYKF